MKFQDIILDIIGFIIIGLATTCFFFFDFGWKESLGAFIIGLALFLFKASKINQFIVKVINKYLKK